MLTIILLIGLFSSYGQDRQFLKFKDGTVIFAGKFYLQESGKIPKDKTFYEIGKIHGFKVIEIRPTGCKVCECHGDDIDITQQLFIDGFTNALSGHVYFNGQIILMKGEGVFTETMSDGSLNRLQKFDYGVESTKEEYLGYLKKTGVIKDTPSTNNINTNAVIKTKD